MMKNSVAAFSDIWGFLEKAVARCAPEWSVPVDELSKAVMQANQCVDGRLTRTASDARQKRRNPFFRTTSLSTAMFNAERARQANLKKFAKLLPGVIEAFGLVFQAELEIEVLTNARAANEPTNRKKRARPNSDDPNIQHFIDWMDRYQIRPYVFGRLSEEKLAFIARLIGDARDDPTYQEPGNVWPLMFQAGLLDAPGAAPSADEQKLLGEAYHRLHKPEEAQLREALEQRIGRPLAVSPYLAVAVEAILSRADNIGEQEACILFAGAQEQIEDDVEVIHLLIDGAMAKSRIAAALRSIRHTASLVDDRAEYENDFAMATLVDALEECAARNHLVTDWPELVWRDLVSVRSTVSQHIRSREQFWALFAAALKLSGVADRYAPQSFKTGPLIVQEAEWRFVESASDQIPPQFPEPFEASIEEESYQPAANALTISNSAPDEGRSDEVPSPPQPLTWEDLL